MASYDSPQLNELLGGTAASSPTPTPKAGEKTAFDSPQLNALLGGGDAPAVAPVKEVSIPVAKPVDRTGLFNSSSKSSGVKTFLSNLFGKKDTGPALQAKIGENLSPEDAANADLVMKNQVNLKAPGTTIKAPFIDKGIQVPDKGGIGAAYGLLKQAIEFPERTIKTFGQKNNSELEVKTYTVPSYSEVASKTTAQLMDEGMPAVAAIIFGSAVGSGEFANDALVYEGLLASGARKAESRISKITNDELKTAHEFLGNPKTLEEARIARNKIQREFHPDKTGNGSDAISKQANNAYRILEKEGIPGGKAVGKVNKMPQTEPKRIGTAPVEDTIHPTLKQEVQAHLKEHGPEVTSQALVEKMGVTHEQAAKIITTVRSETALANPTKAAQEVLNRVVPPKEVKTPTVTQPKESKDVIVVKTESFKSPEEFSKAHPEVKEDITEKIKTAQNAIDIQETTRIPEARQDQIIYKDKKGNVRIVDREVYDGTKDYSGAVLSKPDPIEGEVLAVVKTDKTITRTYEKKDNHAPAASPKKEEITTTPAPKKEETVTVPDKEKEQMNSRVYERLQAEHSELEGELKYDEVKLKEDAEKAVELLTTDKQKAFRIAMGAEESADVLSTSVNIAMAEKALDEGNKVLYSQLIKNRSLAQTRRGQEIVAEKSSITDNSTTRYVKELLSARLEILGKKYLTNLSLETKGGVSIKKVSNKKRATDIIKEEVKKVKEKISSTKQLDLAEAQALIDSLAC